MTGSMQPELQEKELILIKECEKYNLEDVVTYVDIFGNLVTHRILQIDEICFTTKGDNNEVPDESTNIHNIQGKVVYHSKVLGVFVLDYLKVIILIYTVILLVLFMKDKFVKESENEEKEK